MYPLKVGTTDEEPNSSTDCTPDSMEEKTPQGLTTDNDTGRSRRSTAVEAREDYCIFY